MSASIFGDRIYSYRQKPWHGLGIQTLMKHNAVQALQLIGSYAVVGSPIHAYTVLEDGTEATVPIEDRKAVLRLPTDDDPYIRVLGQIEVTKDVISPFDLCDIWDRSTGRFVETLGGLGQGENFFISTKLEVFDVKGDEVEQYLLVHMDYRGKLQVSLVTIRVVCINTLTAAENAALEVHQIDLARYPRQQLEIILTDVPARKEAESAALKEVMEIMRSTRTSPDQDTEIIRAAFPLPTPPVTSGIKEADQENEQRYQKAKEATQANRQAVLDLLDGHEAGRGLTTLEPSCYKTYNAVAELVDWGGGSIKPETFFKSVITGGHRAAVKGRAWKAGLQLIHAGG